ncbi:MAG: AAA family ATPase [Selenomonas sp.]|uniref:AAA family ATPase n=1 Tax=Selenomonas sp. AB3002 TaxID=1392502 RepID=UPI0004981FE7|nr:AAA family ATPase [Selenomonas sp.]
MTGAKRLPVGTDDYKRLREDFYFVDKTRFIKEILDQHSEVTLITRPRRFGKSMAMSMLKYFFTLKGAEENRALFAGTDIEAVGGRYMQEQGQWPVVMLSLKDIKPLKYSDMVVQVASHMHDLYAEFRYLYDDEFLSADERVYFEDILLRRAAEGDLQLALGKLLYFLQSYHQKTVILLIDEYDSPVQAAWSAKESYYDEAIAFMRTFLTAALKGNTALRFGVLTGVLRIAKESIFSALNNLEVSTVVNGKYADIFGFTPEETAGLARELDREDKLEELKAWYDGYNFSGCELYNPWSVVNYFANDCKPDIFWLNTSGNDIIAGLMKQAGKKDEKKLLTLLQGGTVETAVQEGLIYTDIYRSKDALYTMLQTTGYLTSRHTEFMGGRTYCELAIPNMEVSTVYETEIVNRYRGELEDSDLFVLLRYLLRGQAEEFAQGLQEYLVQIASFHDTAEKETFYHGFLLGIMAWLMPKYRVVSNRESGYGRFDLGIFPKEVGIPGILMEFKVAEHEEELEDMAGQALAQTEEKDYLAEFRAQGVDEVWRYGVAFCGKKICLVAGKSG